MISWVWSLIKLIFEILLVAAFLHSFISHFILWLDIRSRQIHNDPSQNDLSQNIPIQNDSNIHLPWKLLIKNLLIETGCTFVFLILFPFKSFIKFSTITPSNSNSNLNTNLNTNPKTPPILLIHGYLHNKTDWLWFHQQLQSIEGMGPVFTLNLSPLTNSIAEDAANVKKIIQQIKEDTGQDKIILIGHSRGGLVASFYAERLATPNTVVAVINIATPFSGTQTAVLGIINNVKELAPNAPFLTELKEKIQHSKISYYYICSKLDNLVIPWYSACPWQLRTSSNTFILDDYGHLGLLLSSRVINQVVSWIFKA